MKKLLFVLLLFSTLAKAQNFVSSKIVGHHYLVAFDLSHKGQSSKPAITIMMSDYQSILGFDYKRFNNDILKYKDHSLKFCQRVNFEMDALFDQSRFDYKQTVLYVMSLPNQKRA